MTKWIAIIIAVTSFVLLCVIILVMHRISFPDSKIVYKDFNGFPNGYISIGKTEPKKIYWRLATFNLTKEFGCYCYKILFENRWSWVTTCPESVLEGFGYSENFGRDSHGMWQKTIGFQGREPIYEDNQGKPLFTKLIGYTAPITKYPVIREVDPLNSSCELYRIALQGNGRFGWITTCIGYAEP